MGVRIRWRGLELPLRVRVDAATQTDTYGRFVAEPFQRGFGVTLGHLLKSMLLGSLEGNGACSFRVKGLKAGADSIPHVKENLDHLGLNVKRLRVRLNGQEEAMLKAEVDGKDEMLAADFEAMDGVEILNPDLRLATISDQGKVSLEIRVRKGRGYRLAKELTLPDLAANEVPVDAFFSPVRRVECSVESTRVGKMTNYDRLIIQIWTSGAMSPEDALVEAGLLLQKHLNTLVQLSDIGVEVPMEDRESAMDSADAEQNRLLATPVSTLDLSVRAHNCLVSANIQSVGELVVRTEDELLKIRNFGKTSLKEIGKKLGDLGLSFADGGSGALDDDPFDEDDDEDDEFDVDGSDVDDSDNEEKASLSEEN